jgi:hypothetical protein
VARKRSLESCKLYPESSGRQRPLTDEADRYTVHMLSVRYTTEVRYLMAQYILPLGTRDYV